MAKQPGYQSRSTNSGTGELKSRLLFVLGALIVYRIGSFIPLPGIDAAVLAQLVEQQKGTIIDMLNMFSGGASLEFCMIPFNFLVKKAGYLNTGVWAKKAM